MGSITVTGLSKAYKQYHGRWARLVEWLLPDSNRPLHTLKWVLKDVSFAIEPGEAVGIVGVNGAGKSTLLKMIAGTTQPTTGSVQIAGRVAALLELGMGFHPDFTGRQNAIMAGQLQGLSEDDVHALMPEIEAFADIGDYIDQPVRVYSSGMQVRLAFAVATARRPEVLIVDEALSVGDAAFQRKCYRRIEEFQLSGTTLLLVSHDVETVKRLCSKAVYLRNGAAAIFDQAKLVCDRYEKDLFGGAAGVTTDVEPKAFFDDSMEFSNLETHYGDGTGAIENVRLVDWDDRAINMIPEGVPFSVGYTVRFNRPACQVEFGMMLKTVDGICLYGTNSAKHTFNKDYAAGELVRVRFNLQGNLAPGSYSLNVGATHVVDGAVEVLHRRMDVLMFRISGDGANIVIGNTNMFGVLSVARAPESSTAC